MDEVQRTVTIATPGWIPNPPPETSFDTLEQKAFELASVDRGARSIVRSRLLIPRAEENVSLILTAYQSLREAMKSDIPLSAPAQLFVENFTPIERQLREICVNLKPNYDDDLPKLADGPLANYPRIFAIALSFTTHSQGLIGADSLRRFFHAYQHASPLCISELLAIPVALRLALIEELKEAISLLGKGQQRERNAELVISNIVSTLRWLPSFDTQRFVQSLDLVDPILASEPYSTYTSMEPHTRDSYRRAVVSLAARSGFSEPHVARKAVDLARQANPNDRRRAHVGYYLIDDGVSILEDSLGYRPNWRERLSRSLLKRPTLLYLGSLTLLTSVIITCFVLYALSRGASIALVGGLLILIVAPVCDLVLNALNNNLPLKPTSLPKLDFPHGIPLEARTMVVVPTVLSSEPVVEELIGRLEEHYLANQDEQIFFALLSDWSDADNETMPGDEALLRAAAEGIDQLNSRHSAGGVARFYLFHRRRAWNESEGKWIGWERKRGKLREFNRLLRGSQTTSFISGGDEAFLAGVRYVLTLDSDTYVGRDVARRLIGTISHPLNEPQLDKQTRRVVNGYGIIQPRVVVLPAGPERSRIPAILTNRFDVNDATPPFPNLYQDLFKESHYIGKALYDVDTFEAALENRVPENRVLSHDLLEGMYARAALASEIKIFDSAESHYEAATKRQHRWTRGDWQVLPWLMPRVRDEQGKLVRNVLTPIARWQIIDTLRRSVMPIAVVLWLLAGWTVLPGSPIIWSALVVLTLATSALFTFVPTYLLLIRQTPPGNRRKRISHVMKITARQLGSVGLQLLISFTFIAHQLYLATDAIARTLYRRFVSHKHLLEWVTAAQVKRESARTPLMFLRYMWPALVVVLACIALIFITKPSSFLAAAPFLLVWALSPLTANFLSNRLRARSSDLELEVESAIRLNGRRMWRVLESFPGSSPVNLTRRLLWTEAAYQLGTFGLVELFERLDLAERDLKHESVDQRATGPLAPNFILTAESGNLAGYARTLKQSCNEIITRPLDERVVKGLADTFTLIRKEFSKIRPEKMTDASLAKLQLEFEAAAALVPDPNVPELTVTGWLKLLDELARRATEAQGSLAAIPPNEISREIREISSWNASLIRQTQSFSRDFKTFHGWTAIDSSDMGDLTEQLEQVHPISLLPEIYARFLLRLAKLPRQDELKSAVKDSLENSKSFLSAWSELAKQSEELPDLSMLFDEERRISRGY